MTTLALAWTVFAHSGAATNGTVYAVPPEPAAYMHVGGGAELAQRIDLASPAHVGTVTVGRMQWTTPAAPWTARLYHDNGMGMPGLQFAEAHAVACCNGNPAVAFDFGGVKAPASVWVSFSSPSQYAFVAHVGSEPATGTCDGTMYALADDGWFNCGFSGPTGRRLILHVEASHPATAR